MKKILTLCLALLLILSAMSGCTVNTAPANTTSAEVKTSIEPTNVLPPVSAEPASASPSETSSASQSINGAPIRRIYGKDDNKIETGAGMTFVIQLDENPTTGYQWSDAVIDNKEVIQQTATNYEATPVASGIAGSGGTRTITFKALKAGKATITLNYQRSWEKKPANTLVFNVSVN